MPEGDPAKDHPSLELPRLNLRRRRRPAQPAPQPVDEPVDEPVSDTAVVRPPAARAVALAEPARAATRRPIRVARPGGTPAVVLTGILVGLGIVGLTWSGLRVCEGVRGTSSCGGGGYPLLAAVVALMVVVGALLLRGARVPDPGTTSVLAVALTAVLALLFLVDSLLDTAMLVVIPLICAGSFAAAHWLTRTFTDPALR